MFLFFALWFKPWAPEHMVSLENWIIVAKLSSFDLEEDCIYFLQDAKGRKKEQTLILGLLMSGQQMVELFLDRCSV